MKGQEDSFVSDGNDQEEGKLDDRKEGVIDQ